MVLEEIREIVADCKYEDWNLWVHQGEGHLYLQVSFLPTCKETGKPSTVNCRKWLISQYMTRTEIVRTVHFAIQTAVLHEFNEAFLYKGVRVSNPHIDIGALISISSETQIR